MDYPPLGSESLPQDFSSWLPPPPQNHDPAIEHSSSASYSQLLPLSSYNQPISPFDPVVQACGNTTVDYSNGIATGQTSLSVDPNANNTVAQSQQLPVYNSNSNADAQPIAPQPNSRKRKAPTLRNDNWEPVKARVIELHIDQNRPLPEVKEVVEQEFKSISFTATIRQYRTRLSQWGLDKNVKPNEMKAIVRKRQQRTLAETNKGKLVFKVRGNVVEEEKIERWMKRNKISDDMMYAPSPAADTPAALSAWTISESGSPAPSAAAFGGDWEMSPAILPAQDMTLINPEASEQKSSMLPPWASADGFILQDLPWFRFHSLIFSFDNFAFANSPTRDALKAHVPDHPDGENNELDLKNKPESMNIVTTVLEQGDSFQLEEVMPECFRIHIALNSQTQSILSAQPSTIQLAETSLFLAANNLLDDWSLVKSVKKTLDTNGDQFFKQLFKLESSTVQSFTCRLLESLSSRGSWCDSQRLLECLVRCGLDLNILAGPTGGRCLQLAIWRYDTSLALLLIRNGVQRNPKLGSTEPFNQTPVQLAESRQEWDVLDALLARPSDRTNLPPPQPVQLERTEGEIALQEAINANDIERIHSLLMDGLDIDSARTSRGDLLLEWTFFENRMCYNTILPYSHAPNHLWTVPGIISAATTSEKLEVYLWDRMSKDHDGSEDEEGHDEYDLERYDVLQRSVELGLAFNGIHEVQTILALEWVREYLDLEELLKKAASARSLDVMVELVTYGADCMILDEVDNEHMGDFLEDILSESVETGRLRKLLKIGWFPLEDVFIQNLDMLLLSSRPWLPQSPDPLEKVQMLIDHGLDLNSALHPKKMHPSVNSEWCTPLELAVYWGPLEVVRYLVHAGADIHNTPVACSSHTTLGLAVRGAKPEIVQFLVQSSANLEEFADDQETTLMELAVSTDEYYDLEILRILEVLKILLENGADINGPIHRKPTTRWNTALTRAILDSEEHEIIYFALDAGADIHQVGGGEGARTPLQAAAQKGDVEIAKELLRRGACVNAQPADDHGRTALQAACDDSQGFEEMILLLLQAGADDSAPPAPKYGRTALQALCCSESPSSELVAFLIDRGVDINAPAADYGGVTALQGAASMGNIKIVILLLEKGANVNAPPSRQEGRMALDGAAENGRLDTVQLLLTFGATCMVPGVSGYDSAVDFAEDNGHFAIADILRSYNRKPEGELFDGNMRW